MAESGKITREDIIAKDAFTSAVEEAKELLKVVTDIQNALKTRLSNQQTASLLHHLKHLMTLLN